MVKRLQSRRQSGRNDLSDIEIENISRISGSIAKDKINTNLYKKEEEVEPEIEIVITSRDEWDI